MKIPYMKSINTSQPKVLEFKGLNRNLSIGEGEAQEFFNLSTDDYPCLRPIKGKNILKTYDFAEGNLNGIYYKNKLLECVGTKVYWDGKEVTELTLTDSPKTFAEFQAYLFIFPDKKYINTALYGTDDIIDGDRVVGDIDIELTGLTCIFRNMQDNTDDGIRGQIKNFTLLSYQDSGTVPFTEGDIIHISGFEYSNYDGDYEILGIDRFYILLEPNLFGLETSDSTTALTQENITISRKMPDLDFMCECNGRLWGCVAKYGTSGGQILASKSGDPWNWYYQNSSTPDLNGYEGIIASDGDFTGCIAYQGNIYFFKEDMIYQIYGSRTSNFQAVEIGAMGVEKGSENSLCIINEVLYYKSKIGIMQFTGGLPSKVSYQLGNEAFKNASAGTDGRNYYVSMIDSENKTRLFVYDTVRGMWHEESGSGSVKFFIEFLQAEKLYQIDKGANFSYMLSVDNEDRGQVEWKMATGDIDYTSPNKKYVKKIAVRFELPTGANLKISVIYDDNTVIDCAEYSGDDLKKSKHFNLKPKRCDHFNVVFEGVGDCVIYQLTKYISVGSDK